MRRPFVLAALFFALPAHAVTLMPGDILVADSGPNGPSTPGSIIHIDPVSGDQTLVSSGGYLFDPYGITVNAAGEILVAEHSASDLLKIDPESGSQTRLIVEGGLGGTRGIAIDASGQIVVADENCSDGRGGAVRIDPITGTKTIVSEGDPFFRGDTRDLTIAPDGHIIVADLNLFQVDPQTGEQSLLLGGGVFGLPMAVTTDDGGRIFFGASGSNYIVELGRGIIAEGGWWIPGAFQIPAGLAFDLQGQLLVADGTGEAVFRVDPETGAQTLLSSGGFLDHPLRIFVVPIPEPSTALLLACGLVGSAAVGRRRL